MIDFYLITGFLGSGKTSFLKEFVRFLFPKKIRLIVNEYGKVGVDGELLAEVGAVIDEINNGSIFCSCRLDKFEEALDSALLEPPEALVVEASGLSDPTGIHKILSKEEYKQFNYKGCICLADATRFEKVFNTARVCPKQLSVSDVVLINKIDIAQTNQIENVKGVISECYPDIPIYETSFGKFESKWFEDLRGRALSIDVDVHSKDITLQKATITIKPCIRLNQLESFLKMFIEHTYRVKGIVEVENSLWLIDCVGAQVNIVPWSGKTPENIKQIVALAGAGMPLRKSLKEAVEWYKQEIESVE